MSAIFGLPAAGYQTVGSWPGFGVDEAVAITSTVTATIRNAGTEGVGVWVASPPDAYAQLTVGNHRSGEGGMGRRPSTGDG